MLLLHTVTPPERLLAATMEPGTGMVADAGPLLEAEEAEEQDALSYLQTVATRLEARGLRVTFEAPEADACNAIVDRAREHAIDLIAMATHDRGGLSRLVFGSVGESVLRHAPCPVLVVRVV